MTPAPVTASPAPDPASPARPPSTPSSRGRLVAVLVVVAACLAPFLDKAYTVDDTLFLRLAEHLHQDPLDFYGFGVNWYGATEPMWTVTKNPPLMGYLLSGAAALAGWSEVTLHGVTLLAALAVAWATFLLARRLCAHPLQATLLGLLTPVFLVSSTTVMCDTPMLALWCWAVLLWVTGLDDDRPALLWLGAGAAALGLLTKYFAIALIPLLLAYGLARRRGPGRWMLPLVVPMLVAAAYEWVTWRLYPELASPLGLLSDAVVFSGQARSAHGTTDLLASTWVGLAFAGGCLLTPLVLAPLLHRPRTLLAWAALGAGLTAWMTTTGGPWAPRDLPGPSTYSAPWSLSLQCVLMVLACVSLVTLAARELRRPRDPGALLLALWIGGTFVFAAFLNWSNNGRSNLPMAPALGILLVRQLQTREVGARLLARGRLVAAAAPAFVLALLITWADSARAGSVREAVQTIHTNFVRPGQRPCVFQGHWGFQYYMEQAGATAWEFGAPLQQGTIVVLPSPNVDFWMLDFDGAVFDQLADLEPEPRFLHTLARDREASFYASVLGRLPWAFGSSDDERYLVLEARTDAAIVQFENGALGMQPAAASPGEPRSPGG